MFARRAVDQDLLGALGLIASLLNDGVAVETVLLLVVAPSARLLRDEWMVDESTPEDVTAGLELLHQVIQTLAASPADARDTT